MIEAPHAAVPGGQSYSAHRQISLIQKALRGKQAMRLRDRDWRRTEMFQKQTAQVTFTHSQTIREIANARRIERARGDLT
jgi:hypothetical protein